MNEIAKIIKDSLADVFENGDKDYIHDSKLLGEIIHDNLECTFTGLSSGAESVLIESCQETHKLAHILIRGYIRATLAVILPKIVEEIKIQVSSDLEAKRSRNLVE